ncbi:hypothetical protein G7Z17_g10315 [Cylindrodendrum hubeiense]|uniref:Nudix hydrolase domain-containing protein n=1 Tax=Cylindrodendrum hubeiense TaxID=595255 RepID=A0A9P5L4W7_9HYPO|nr:hypothetical protein G7Z17_g10315 [Cylindrodendrum hubeiense]
MTEAPSVAKSPPGLDFTFDESVSEWNIPGPQWLKLNEKTWDGLASGALVFDDKDRILLVQRAPNDSMPNLWEIPGGAVDDDDPSVLYGCARELWEEAGLVARHVKHVIPDGFNGKPGAVFTNRTGKIFWCKFSFEVDVIDTREVKLDPNEHQDFVWATEEEVINQAIGERKIPLANSLIVNILREGFQLRRSGKETKAEAAAGDS